MVPCIRTIAIIPLPLASCDSIDDDDDDDGRPPGGAGKKVLSIFSNYIFNFKNC